MGKDLRRLRLGKAVVHRSIEVVRNLGNVAAGDEGADSDETPISRSKIGAQPKVTEQNISGVLHDSRSDIPELLSYGRCAFCLRVVVERKKRR